MTLAFRRWERARVRPGSRLRTAVGVLAVESVEVVSPGAISEPEARRAGYPERSRLVAELDRHGAGDVYRIRLRFAGTDPRVALGARRSLSREELADVRRRLARFDAASGRGEWTRRVLELIRDRPGRRAAELAAAAGRPTGRFKTDVRKLKGLTESLGVGYRLSPRARADFRRL